MDKNIERQRAELVQKTKHFFKSLFADKSNHNSNLNNNSNFSTNNSSVTDQSEEELTKKKDQLFTFAREKKQWLIYLAVGLIIWFGSYIRTRNFWLLKDIAGNYIIGDLDSFVFYRYAKEILEHGALMAIDPMRFVPFGTPTIGYAFMSYFIAYLYKIIHLFNSAVSLMYVDAIYPVICFVVALIFFFLFVRKIFDWKIGLLSTLFLAIVPAFIQRTMAGSSDHEALAMMFFFMAMYFYAMGWYSQTNTKTIVWSILAGLSTRLMGLTWGGWKFLILNISLFTLVEFFFDKIQKKDVYQFTAWVFSFVIATTTFIPLFTLKSLLKSFMTAIPFLILVILLVDLILFKLDLLKLKEKIKTTLTKLKINLPLSMISLIISIVLGLSVLFLFLGPTVFLNQSNEIINGLLHPMSNDRWELTVAEQHQPYFADWMSEFGPSWFGIPLYLTLFFLGSFLMFYNMVKKNKNSLILTLIFMGFVFALSLSRYSSESATFNGVSFISKLIYLGSFVVFALLAAYLYLYSFYKDQSEYQKIISWDKHFIFVLIWFIIMVIAARGAIRLVFVFAPVTAVLAAYAVMQLGEYIFMIKKNVYRYLALAVLLLILLNPFALASSLSFKGIIPVFSEVSLTNGKYSGIGYTQQWQIAGEWVKKTLPLDAVFGHWWDYGYWVQTGFERATVLDGANKIKYWNYLMGRHVLTAQNQTEALEFLKVHNTTHYLIVSDEIGKYTAYSSIGSDENYDRYSWIMTFLLDEKSTQETRDKTILTYTGGFMLDDDFVWNDRVYPRMGAGIGGVFLPIRQIEVQEGNETKVGIDFEQPTMALVYRGQRVDVPMTCLYVNDKVKYFDGPGYNGCFRLIPTINNDNGQVDNPFGAGLFVSEKGVNALWVNLYVFDQNNPKYDTSAFESVYKDQYISTIAVIKGRLIGPMKIWQINYPEGFTVDEETKQKYLGGNELLPDYFYEVN